jgi:hypothetical protein
MSDFKKLVDSIREIQEATPADVGRLAVKVDSLQAQLTKLEVELTKAAKAIKHPTSDALRKTRREVDKLNGSISDFIDSSAEILRMIDK